MSMCEHECIFWKSIIALLLYSVFNTTFDIYFLWNYIINRSSQFLKKLMSRTGKRIESNENIIMTLNRRLLSTSYIFNYLLKQYYILLSKHSTGVWRRGLTVMTCASKPHCAKRSGFESRQFQFFQCQKNLFQL